MRQIIPGLPPIVQSSPAADFLSELQVAPTHVIREFVKRIHGASYQSECAPIAANVPGPSRRIIVSGGLDSRHGIDIGQVWAGPVTDSALTFLVLVNSKALIQAKISEVLGLTKEHAIDYQRPESFETFLVYSRPAYYLPQKVLDQHLGTAVEIARQHGRNFSLEDFKEGVARSTYLEENGCHFARIPIRVDLKDQLPSTVAKLIESTLTVHLSEDALLLARNDYERKLEQRRAVVVEQSRYYELLAAEYRAVAEGWYPIIKDATIVYLISSSGELLAIDEGFTEEMPDGKIKDRTNPTVDVRSSCILGDLGDEQQTCFNGVLLPESGAKYEDGVNTFRDAQFNHPEYLFRVPRVRVEEGKVIVLNPTKAMENMFSTDFKIGSGKTQFSPQEGKTLTFSTPWIRVPSADEVRRLRPAFNELLAGVNECYGLIQGVNATPETLKQEWMREGVPAVHMMYQMGQAVDEDRERFGEISFASVSKQIAEFNAKFFGPLDETDLGDEEPDDGITT